MKKITKVLISLVFTFSLFILLNTVAAASDFTIKNMDFNAVLNSDGSMDVTETWSIKINGETNTLFKEYDLKGGQYNIRDVRVKDITNGKELTQIHDLMYHVTTGYFYAMKNSNGVYEIAWGVNKSERRNKI